MSDQQLKTDNMRHWLLSSLVLCGLAGAVAGQSYLDRVREPYLAPPTLNADSSNAPGVLQRAARTLAVAGAYNRASDAVRSSNRVALAGALDDLQQLKAASRAEPLALAAAEEIVSEAGTLDMQAQNLKGAQARNMQAQAALRYREALRLSPRFNSGEPDLVNAVGYFLAERGSTPADFREAERLTRRALQLWDARVQAKDERDSETVSDSELASEMFSRANTRDSLAWALYRQARYEEALCEQQRAVIEATVSSKALRKPQSVPAELHFHLGEIYRVLKRWDEAREQYLTALELKPEDAATQQALKQLPANSQAPAGALKKMPAKPNSKGGRAVPKSLQPERPIPEAPAPDDSEPEAPLIPESGPLIARS